MGWLVFDLVTAVRLSILLFCMFQFVLNGITVLLSQLGVGESCFVVLEQESGARNQQGWSGLDLNRNKAGAKLETNQAQE